MSQRRYERYKDSGIEWMGEVPSHWDLITLGRITRTKCDGPFGSGLKSEHYTDDGVRVIRLQNIRRAGFDATDAAFIDVEYYNNELQGHEVRNGDVLIAGLGDERNTVGRACVAPPNIEPAMVKADCFRFRLDTARARAGYVAAQLSAGSTADAGTLSTGSTRSRIPLSTMASRKVALPPLPEQEAIEFFLDRETTKIDALIAQQERLITLLAEKRLAVISNTVTKGLDPTVEMRYSGVPFLGYVPSHWIVSRLKHVATIQTGIAKGKDFADAETVLVPYLRVANVQDGYFKLDDVAHIAVPVDDVERYLLRKGDVLMNEGGDNDKLGRGHVWTGEIEPCIHQNHVFAVRPHRVSPDWLNIVTGSCYAQFYFLGRAKQSTNLASISSTNLMELPIVIPPSEEQETISRFLHGETAKIDHLVSESRTAIALLQERRTAIISAAVTGKIDVREQVPVAAS